MNNVWDRPELPIRKFDDKQFNQAIASVHAIAQNQKTIAQARFEPAQLAKAVFFWAPFNKKAPLRELFY